MKFNKEELLKYFSNEKYIPLFYYYATIQSFLLHKQIEHLANCHISNQEYIDLINNVDFIKSIYPKEISNDLLSNEEFQDIRAYINYLSKYTELYNDLDIANSLFTKILSLYSNDITSVINFNEILENSILLEKLKRVGIEEYVKHENKSLDEKLCNKRNQSDDDSVFSIANQIKNKIRF